MITAVPHIRAITPYALADPCGPGTVSLAQNESAFPASPAAIAAGRAASDDMRGYPDPDWSEMRAAIAEVHGLDRRKILCGAGAMELIGCLVGTFAGAGDRVLGTDYGYAYVASAAAQVQADYIRAREVEFTVSINDILVAVGGGTKIVFVCNPGNPTGTLIPNSHIIRLRKSLADNILLVVDQAYAEFSDDQNDPTEIFSLVNRGDTVTVRTFSKAYGLAGARAGWGYFPPEIAIEMRKILNPNNISGPSQAMAAAAARDQAHMRQTVARTIEIRDSFAAGCRDLGLTVPQSRTNFVLLCFASAEEARRADNALRKAGLLMRGMSGYGLPDCLRATICDAPIMNHCLSVLRGVLE